MSPTIVATNAISRARRLRRDMTDGEKRLWSCLRELKKAYGVHVRKQVPIGPYVVDFAVHSAKLVIEVDGHFHFEGDGPLKDARRDAGLKEAGYKVLRFNTGDVSDACDDCVERVIAELGLMN